MKHAFFLIITGAFLVTMLTAIPFAHAETMGSSAKKYPCRVRLQVEGMAFSPRDCRFVTTISGTPDGEDTYELILHETIRGDWSALSVANFRSIEKGTYAVTAALQIDPDFRAEFVDVNGTGHPVQEGKLVIRAINHRWLMVSFDLFFISGERVRGSGRVLRTLEYGE